MKLTCCLCGRKRDESSCEVFKTSMEEKDSLRKMGEDPKDSYAYCRACSRMMGDPERALNLMKGVVQVRLQRAGVPNAEKLAENFVAKLRSRTPGVKGSRCPTPT